MNCSSAKQKINMAEQVLDTNQKALSINLDRTIYGTFAEIGAGQEIARNWNNCKIIKCLRYGNE